MPALIRRNKGHGNRAAALGIRKPPYARSWPRVIVCASGPSFSTEQAAIVQRAQPEWKVIVTNTTWQRVPTADVLYGGDRSWWETYMPMVQATFHGECWTVNRWIAHHHHIHHIDQSDEPGLSTVGGRIHTGGNSGYAAIGLAYVFGAKHVRLVGFDFQDTYGLAHWHGNHPPQLNQDRPYAGWIKRMPPLIEGLRAHGVDIINCSIETAIPDTVIPRGDLRQCLSLSDGPQQLELDL